MNESAAAGGVTPNRAHAPNADASVVGTVLVVDDEHRNRELLRDLLEAQGQTVHEAEDGLRALDLAPRVRPHVILLDVMMPGIDGFEVCRRLKADPETSPIPVLLVTALNEREERLRGIEVGASDFLSKPVDLRDLLLRTRNAIRSKRLYDQVQEELRRVQAIERQRDDLTHMIVHDLRSPLQGILASLDLLQMTAAPALVAEDRTVLANALGSTKTLIDMVSSLLDIGRLEAGQMPLHRESTDLLRTVRDAMRSIDGLLKQSPVDVDPVAGAVPAVCDVPLIRRVMANLLGNAAKYAPAGRPIRLQIRTQDGFIRVSVTDDGPGIAPEFHARIFEKFGQADEGTARKRNSTGLGLTFCKLVVEAHGGHIGLDSAPGHGSTFWFTLPA